MKYVLGRRVVATAPSKDRETKWPRCSICGKTAMSMSYTVEYKKVCYECQEKDKEAEFVSLNT